MNILEVASQFTAIAVALGQLLGQARAALDAVRPLMNGAFSDIIYENILLEASLDIRDSNGARAVLYRRQRVRFLVRDAAAIRDVVWGDGNAIARYATEGAKRLSVVPEGSKRAILLRVEPQPGRGRSAQVTTRRVIEHGLTNRTEYLEAMVERPTDRLTLRVLFPTGTKPSHTYVVSSTKSGWTRKLPVRWGADGRPYVVWKQENPRPYLTYGIRWSW